MRAIATAAALLLASLAAAASPEPPAEARVQKDLGDARRKAGDLDGALEAYRAALKLFGGYAEAHEAVGEVRYAQKKVPEAIEAFLAAVELDPAYAFAWYNLAFAARKSGDLAHARAAYERYVRLRPADPDGHFGFAETLRAQGEREPAIREYQLFVDLARSEPAQASWVEKARAALAELKTAGAPPPPTVAATPEAARVEAAGAAAAVITPVDPAGTTALPAPAAGAPAAPAGPPVVPLPAPAPPPGPAAAPQAPAAVAALAAPPSQALIEKLGAGDRAFLARDYRGALFLYQDAIYMAPASVPARIRLARCYAALRYPAQAEAQLTQALELDPASGEARKLLDELRALPPPPLPVGPGVVQAPGAGRPPVEPPGAGAGTAAPVAPPAVLGSGSTGTLYRLAPEAPGPSPASRQAAAELYRAAVAQIAQRDFAGAADGLTRALALDPSLALAYEARASARFGLGQHQEAARDYQTAAALTADRASPLWGLAECYRLLGDPRAAETYERFAASPAQDATEPLREQARRRAQELRRP